jgi:hypothetical protein
MTCFVTAAGPVLVKMPTINTVVMARNEEEHLGDTLNHGEEQYIVPVHIGICSTINCNAHVLTHGRAHPKP